MSNRKPGEPTKAARKGDDGAKVIAYRHDQKRRNNPDVGAVTPETDPEQPKTRWAYDPHIDPALQFDVRRAGIERLIDDALASGDESTMRGALNPDAAARSLTASRSRTPQAGFRDRKSASKARLLSAVCAPPRR